MSEPTRNALDVILAELAPLSGKTLLDIGCGAGKLQAPLKAAGALWRGLDPVGAASELPIDAAPAEQMPYGDDHFDLAICVNALHHVPVKAMGQALSETARVLRPGGTLVVIEPLAVGALSQVIAVVDDETEIRGAAQRAMDQTTDLVQVKRYDYARADHYADFDGFCDVLVSVDPERADQITMRKDALHRAFLDKAQRDETGWTLSQPMSVRVFQPD